VLDDFVHCLQAGGVMALLEQRQGAAIQREMSAFAPDVLLDGVKTRFGIASMKAVPSWLGREQALRPLVGFKAPQVRQGIGPRGATKRQGERAPAPMCPDTLAKHMVQWNVRDLEAVFNGSMRALATAGVVGAKVTGMADGPDLETTERSTGGGPVTRQGRLEEKRGQVHAIEVTVYGWKVLRVIAAVTKMPWAVHGGPRQAHEARWTRALVTQARRHRQGDARRHQGILAQGCWDGTTLWWLDQHAITWVVPATAERAVTAEAQAQAAAGEDLPVGRRGHIGRPGRGHQAWSERLEPEVVGMTDLTP
jgi:hypothetical protein